MYSITLQGNDTAIVSGDVLGQIQFAASNESDTGTAKLIAAQVFSQAEGAFNGTQNPASLVLATATADDKAATGKLKVSDSGHLIPMSDDRYDIGNTNLAFRTSYFSDGVVLQEVTPGDTTDKLYQNGGSLYFDGSAVGGGGGTPVGWSGITIDAADRINVFGGSGHFIHTYASGLAYFNHVTHFDSGIKTILNTETDQATITFNMDESNLHTVTLAGNRTLAVSNVDVGQRFIIRLKQDATGSRTVTWFSTINWPGALVPSLSTTGNKTDVFSFICTATNVYDGFVVGYNL